MGRNSFSRSVSSPPTSSAASSKNSCSRGILASDKRSAHQNQNGASEKPPGRDHSPIRFKNQRTRLFLQLHSRFCRSCLVKAQFVCVRGTDLGFRFNLSEGWTTFRSPIGVDRREIRHLPWGRNRIRAYASIPVRDAICTKCGGARHSERRRLRQRFT